MELFTAFKNSLMLPNKKAVFRLNRISMRDTLVYMFLLLFVAFSPNFIFSTFSNGTIVASDSFDLLLLQLIVLFPLFCIFIGILGASILAAGGIVLKIIIHRKLAYQQLWKMSVFASTLPMIIYFIFGLMEWKHWSIPLILLIIFYLLIFLMIMVYPKRKH